MPFALYLLALAVFAQGTSEFMLSGLLPDIARDLHVPVSVTGSLTPAFAAGMVVGAPLMAVAALRLPRRTALTGFLAVFTLAHVAGATATGLPVLAVTRVVAALANAGFLAVAVATAASLVPPDAKGRATSVLLGGVTLACVAGVPGGALLGHLWGWRAAFWAVAALSLPALAALPRVIPARDAGDAGDAGGAPGWARARRELGALRDGRLRVLLLLGALVNGATFCSFTYLAPVCTGVAGFGAAWVPALLALFGLGSFAGVTAAGRLADTRATPLLAWGGAALLLGWALFAATAAHPAAAAALILVQGALSFAVGSTLITRALYAASGAPCLGGAFATAAFNAGAVAGPAAGAAALAAGLGPRSPLWLSTALVAAALAVAASVRRRGTA